MLHTVAYHDGDRVRPVLHRASISEMVVPYGDPGAMHGWKNAFDAGEWGLGRMANSLQLGCDCLGDIHYFDAVLATEQGEPYTVEHAICMHEEDYGILWKHHDLHGGTDEMRRSRRLVVSFIATVGNYEYGFYWYFYLDGNIQLEVKLTGIVSPMAITPGEQPEFANVIAPGLAAPHHQHLFSARLDLDVDGAGELGLRGRGRSRCRRARQPVGQRVPRRRVTRARHRARPRSATPTRRRAARGASSTESSRNGLGQPVGYKLVPTMSTPTHARVTRVERRPARRFARHNLWVTPYARRRATRRGRVPEPARGWRRPARVDRRRPLAHRHRRRALVHVRRHPLRAPGGLAGDAGRVHGVPALAVRLLRPQPRARRRADASSADGCHADGRLGHAIRRVPRKCTATPDEQAVPVR